MNRDTKERELEEVQFRIEQLKKEAGFFRRKWKQTLLVGAAVTILGPAYTTHSEISRTTRNALETSGTSYISLSIWVAIFYSVAVIIAHWVWGKQEQKKLIALQERKKIVQMELELFFKE